MRDITKKSVNAFLKRKPFKSGNMQVTVDNKTGIVSMLLHNNKIAGITPLNDTHEMLTLSDAGWKTVTTKERLNGILMQIGHARIFQSKGIWYLGDESWYLGDESKEWTGSVQFIRWKKMESEWCQHEYT